MTKKIVLKTTGIHSLDNDSESSDDSISGSSGPTHATINVTGSGDLVLVAGVSGKVTNINRAILTVSTTDPVTTMTVIFKSGTIPLTGPMAVSNPGEIVLDYASQNPWCVVAKGKDFIVTPSNNATVAGMIYYTQV